MTVFLVILPPDSKIDDDDIGVFMPHVYPIVPGVSWAIGTNSRTASDVAGALNLGPGRTAVIAKLQEYNGYAARTLWEKVGEWSEA